MLNLLLQKKIMDYSKFRYQQEKRKKKLKNQKVIVVQKRLNYLKKLLKMILAIK